MREVGTEIGALSSDSYPARIRIIRMRLPDVTITPIFDFELDGAEEERTKLERRDAVVERSVALRRRVSLQRETNSDKRIAYDGLSRREAELRGQKLLEELEQDE